MKNKSPLRYPGGKTRACKNLDAILTKHFDVKTFTSVVSPFFGGGSFEFYLQTKYHLTIVANDKFTPLCSFWDRCKYEKKELCDKLYAHLRSGTTSKTTFAELKKNIMGEQDALTQAFYYFIINRCSFSGATLSGGFSPAAAEKRFTKSSVDRIHKLDLTRFTISNEDFEEFINRERGGGSLLFLDPPYYLGNKSTLYGHKGDMHESFDHVKLFKCLSALGGGTPPPPQCHGSSISRVATDESESPRSPETISAAWFMTYNNCDYIKNLYKNYTIIETGWSYGMNATKESSEIVIINNV